VARLPTLERNDLRSQERYATLTGPRSVRQLHSEPERSAARVEVKRWLWPERLQAVENAVADGKDSTYQGPVTILLRAALCTL
jgi:hypothetical protein